MPVSSPSLAGAVVVVTGASGRLGRVVVRRLAEAGARVAALERSADDVEGTTLTVAADLTDEGSTADAFDRVTEALGAPAALVHTVGMWEGRPLAETALDDWRRVLDVNLTSAFLVFREAVRRMRDAGAGGRLVAVASRQGADRGVAQQAAYSASKAGVVRLVEATADEHRDAGITAAAVAPSTIRFDGDDGAGVSAEAVAALCVWLCGDGGLVHSGTTLRAYGSA